MNADVNANLTSEGITAQLAADGADPAAAGGSAVWGSTGGYLQTRPTGNRYTVLMGRFVNNTGSNATQVTISYRLTISAGGITEETGTRVYYSLTGQAGSWNNLSTLNSTASTDGSSTVSTNLLLNWTNGANLFLLWADDNASGMGTDSANQIDDFSLQVTAGAPVAFACMLNAPTNNALYAEGQVVAVAAAVGSGTPPYTVRFYTNSGAGNTVFTEAGSVGTAPFELNLAGLAAGTYNLYAEATDSAGSPAKVYSVTNTFLVAAPLVVVLTAPVNDATFEHTSAVEGTATVSGGTAPYSVQFYLDGVADGGPVATEPYSHNYGALFVGDHTVQVAVMDSRGWSSSSPVHTVHIAGPLAVRLSPTDGTSYNYGQAVVLSAAAGGGTGPYTVNFYTGEQLVGSLSAPPFTANLGVLPVGSYTNYAEVADSAPTAATAYSTTNVIAILENPLAVALTAPSSGQNVPTNAGFVAAATVTVAAPVTVSSVEFFVDGQSAGVDSTAPYSVQVLNPTLGGHTVYAVATDSLGRQSYSATNQVNAINDPLINDNFANRISLSGITVVTTGSNVGATTEPGEPLGGGFFQRGASLWWSWTAPTNGQARIDTIGSSFNTTLGVFRGTSVNALTQVAFNDNAPGSSDVSLVTFNAVAGTEYQIQVCGAPGFFVPPATGNIQLRVGMPPAITITSPANGNLFVAGSNIPVTVAATSSVGTVTNVDFLRSGVWIGNSTTEPFSFVLTNPPPGTNSIYAVAADTTGQIATSAVVNVLVASIGVTIISPLDGTTFLNTNSITVTAFPYLPSGSITNVEFYVDDQFFGRSVTNPFRATWSSVVPGVHRLTAVGYDNAGQIYYSYTVFIGVAQTLVPVGSVWKYLDNGSDQGTAWVAPDFDDSAWKSGPAELGYGDDQDRPPSPEATVVNGGPPGARYITTYFRRAFNLDALDGFSSLLLQVKRDDGAVVYLNGVEAARFNMPAGRITYTTTTTDVSDDGRNFYTAAVPAELIVQGVNVLAVEIHQSSAASTDISFDLALLGAPQIIRNLSPAAQLVTPEAGTFYVAPATLILTAEASDADGTVAAVEFYAGGVRIGGTTNAPYTILWRDVPPGIHSLTAVAIDNEGARRASAPVTVTVSTATRQWAAYNDHYAGPNTHPNATAWNPFGTQGGAPGAEGVLRNIESGVDLGAGLSILKLGTTGAAEFGTPLPATPAFDLFNGFVDFGSGGANHAIVIDGRDLVIHRFTGLDPNKRYSFRGTAVGGVADYTNRWTLFTIMDADGFSVGNTANVLTSADQPGALYADQAAMNTGDNRSGDVVGWDSIDPGPDGEFAIVAEQYLGPAPGNENPGPNAYGLVAVRLDEFGTLPYVHLTSPPEDAVFQGFTNLSIQAVASAVEGITNVEFYANETLLGWDTASPYGFVWVDAAFGSHDLRAVAYDARGLVSTSEVVTVAVNPPPPNVDPPLVFRANPGAGAIITNLLTIQVLFSEPVYHVDAADMLVNGQPATGVTGSGTNYVFTVSPQPYGPVAVTWAAGHGIVDKGWPTNLPFDENGPGATWGYALVDRTPPVIVLQTPPAGTTVNSLTEVNVTFSEAVAGVEAADLVVKGVPALSVSGSGSNYTFTFAQPSPGPVGLTWAANHGIGDVTVPPNPFAGAGWSYTLDISTVLVQSNSTWLYVKGTNEASTPMGAWRQPEYDDSTWPSAAAPFFYGDTGYTNAVIPGTFLGDMRSNYTSLYLRQSFTASNVTIITNLFLRAQIDDGYVAWINGREVKRVNVSAGELPYSTNATGSPSEPANNGVPYASQTLPDPRGYLVEGTNVLALHVFNRTLTNDDFAVNAQLLTIINDLTVVEPRLLSMTPAAGNVYVLTNITVTFTEPVTGVDAGDLVINGVSAEQVTGGTSNHVYTFSFAQPAYGPVTISWAAGHGIVDFDPLPKPFRGSASTFIWQYSLYNASEPIVVGQGPSAGATVLNLSQITVNFSEPVAGVEAGDLLVNGAPATGVTGSGASYMFFFPQPPYGAVTVTWAVGHGIEDLEVPANAFDPAWPRTGTWGYTLVDQTPPAIAGQEPPAGAHVTNLTQIAVQFTEPVEGLKATDLLINGMPAAAMSGSGATYAFTFPQQNASVIDVSFSTNHEIRDLAAVSNVFDAVGVGTTWSYTTLDTIAPTVANLNPPAGLRLRTLTEIVVTFSEAVSGIEPENLLINGLPAQTLGGEGAGPYTFGFSQPATGRVEVVWAAGNGIRDLASPPNAFGGGTWSYILDPDATTHVIHISVDGLGSAYLGGYVTNSPALFPNFTRLFREGASTLNARCDYFRSETLYNHACMFTGLPAEQVPGWPNTAYHGVPFNSDNGQTIHNSGNPNLTYQYSSFDMAHDYGLSTAFLYSKQSITFYARSWSSGGGPDRVGADNGSNKLDYVLSSVTGGSYGPTSQLIDEMVNRIQNNALWNYTFMHWTEPDQIGHQLGWGSSGYSNAVMGLDTQLGRLLDALRASPLLSKQAVLILSADHGGTGSGHGEPTSSSNFTIPFCLWGAGIPEGVDAYSLFSNRANPGATRPAYNDTSVLQPLRNGDTGNLAVNILGLPPITGSWIIPELKTAAPAEVPLSITKSEAGITLSWPADSEGYVLQSATTLSPVADWQTITGDIASDGVTKSWSFAPPPGAGAQFFRLVKP